MRPPRRAVLKSLGLLGLAPFWPRSAVPISVPLAIPARARKGIACNDPPSVLQTDLRLDWMYVEYGNWVWEPKYSFPSGWTIHLYHYRPPVGDLAKAVAHPNYRGEWIVGAQNESSIHGISPQQEADAIVAQIDLVRQADPQARFVISIGERTDSTLFYEPNSWGSQVWQILPTRVKPFIFAGHTHCYFGNYKMQTIRTYLQNCRNALTPELELWVTEIGKGLAEWASPYIYLYPVAVQTACDGVAHRWAWYGYSDLTIGSYVYLVSGNEAKPTCVGNVFAALPMPV